MISRSHSPTLPGLDDSARIKSIRQRVQYSLDDAVFVFDRIREKLKLSRRDDFLVTVNNSINETLSRTVLTAGLTFIAAQALLLFGGPVLHGFSFVLVVGIVIGMYSSIFVASPILIACRGSIESRRRTTAVTEGARKRT